MYKLIYADPPWAYRNFGDTLNGAARAAYATASLDVMRSWPIGELAAPDSLIFMWATFPKLPEALAVLEAWGFEFVTVPLIWRKVYQNGKPYCGIGFWSRNDSEMIMLGRRGKGLPRIAKGLPQTIEVGEGPETLEGTVGRHSAKPAIFRERILHLVGDVTPRIELFARERATGWDATGLELDGLNIEAFIRGRGNEDPSGGERGCGEAGGAAPVGGPGDDGTFIPFIYP